MATPSDDQQKDPGPEQGVEILDEAVVSESAREIFPCDNCGARMHWDPTLDVMACDHCEHTRAVPRAEGTILERPLSEAGDAARGLGLDLRVIQCDTCGARVTLDGQETTETCVYCGSAQVLARSANRNALRPESLVPLDIGEAAVREGFRRWLKGLWFRPQALKQARAVQAVGIYVPFWTFDCSVRSEWSADAGYYYWVTQTYVVMVNGKPQVRTRQVRRTRWEPAWGMRNDQYDDVLVAASKGLSAELLLDLGAFDTSALQPYQPEFLAGWRAEEYQLDLADGWVQGQARIEASQQARCAGDVPGDTHRFLRVQNTVSDVRWKHVLLPVWSLAYTYGGKSYQVLVHGQSGKVVGHAPYSWLKITMLVLAGVALALAVVAANG